MGSNIFEEIASGHLRHIRFVSRDGDLCSSNIGGWSDEKPS